MRIFRKVSSKHFINFSFNHYVSTWSPLATAFNTRRCQGLPISISLTKDNTGLFAIDQLRTYDGFYLLKEQVINETDILVQEAINPNRRRKMVSIFDELSDALCRVADLAEFVRIAHPRPLFANAAEKACITISGIVEKLNTNKELYTALQNVMKNGDEFPTTSVDEHVASLFLFDFEQSGIHLSEEKRAEVVSLNDYLLLLGQRFMAGSSSSRSIEKTLIPKGVAHLFTSDSNDVNICGLYGDVQNAVAREVAYKVFLSPNKEQEYILDEILSSRYRLARLCGFPTFAHRALKSSLAETPQNVWEFLIALNEKLKPKVQKDFDAMLRIKKEEDSLCNELAYWDVPYLSSKAKKDWLNAESVDYTSYFSLGGCMEGLNTLLQSLYGISLVNEPIEPGEVWDDNIYKLAIVHQDEGLLGHIYCDFFERTSKPNQDCHFTIRGGRRLPDGSYQNPIVVVMLNFPTPKWSTPSLLTPGMVDNLFHEMGHAMHSMLARTEYQHVSGTRCVTDFAEVPSVLMEYFASDPRVLRTFAKHYKTQKPLSEEMLQNLCKSKKIFSACDMQIQVFYSLLDQVYHGEYPLKGTTTEVLADLQNQHYGIPYVPNTAWQLRFSHLVGYGAKYYSYLMSRAVASSIWHKFFCADPFSRTQGERYRYECLAHGGGKPARSLVQDYLKFDLTPESLTSALIEDLCQSSFP